MVKNGDNRKIGLIIFGVGFVILVMAAIILFVNSGNTTDIVEITGSKAVSGIRCVNTERMSFVFEEVSPVSYENVITAVFMDDELSSLSLEYKGEYASAAEADHARDLAESSYNLTMTEKYGMNITDFSRNISVSGDMVYATITAVSSKDLGSKTAALFMLDGIQDFPSSSQDMKVVYENGGFSCVDD